MLFQTNLVALLKLSDSSALGRLFKTFVMAQFKIIHLIMRPVLSLSGMPEMPPIGCKLSSGLDEVKASINHCVSQYWKDHEVDVDLLLFHLSFAEDGRPSPIALDFNAWMTTLHEVSNTGDYPSWMHVPGLRQSDLGTEVFEVSTNSI